MGNSDNPRIGAVFQDQVRKWFEHTYNCTFDLEKIIPIGKPAKYHKFDIVCESKKIVIECKRYTWTKSGNVPSAKMAFTNEAAFYLSYMPNKYEKYIVMYRSYNEKRQMTLAEYYYNTNKHLLGGVRILEYDPDNKEMIEIWG